MNRRLFEMLVLTGAAMGPALFLAGIGLYFIGGFGTQALALTGMGVLVEMIVVRLGASVESLHTIGAKKSGGVGYDSLRWKGRLRVSSLTLNALTVFAVIALAFAVYARAADSTVGDTLFIERVVLILSGALAVWWWLAQSQSLRTPQEIRRSWLRDLAYQALLVLAFFLGAVAILVSFRPFTAFGRELAGPHDAGVIFMASQASVAAALFFARNLPNFYSVFRADRGAQSLDAGKRTKQVLLPTLAAFGLLFVLILVVLAYGIGFADVVDEVSGNPTILALLGLLGVILAATIGFALQVGASQDQAPPLIKQKADKEQRRENLLVLMSGIGALLIVAFGLMVRQNLVPRIPNDSWFDILGIGVLVALGPYGFYAANRHKRIRMMEDRFPDFLRDLASSHKGGLTLYASVEVAARGDYGSLTPEVRKMADQLSWHVPFEEALERFAERVQTPLVVRAVNLILEASRSGGSTTEVLVAAARDAREIKNLENDRRLSMSVYTIVIYVTFFVFLLVASILYDQFIPQILKSAEEAAALGSTNVGNADFGINVTLDDYRVFYFTAAIVQGIGDGILAGMMGSGRAVLGLRHSFLMVLIAWATFVFFI